MCRNLHGLFWALGLAFKLTRARTGKLLQPADIYHIPKGITLGCQEHITVTVSSAALPTCWNWPYWTISAFIAIVLETLSSSAKSDSSSTGFNNYFSANLAQNILSLLSTLNALIIFWIRPWQLYLCVLFCSSNSLKVLYLLALIYLTLANVPGVVLLNTDSIMDNWLIGWLVNWLVDWLCTYVIENIQIIGLCLYNTAYTSKLKQSELLHNFELKIQIIHKLQKNVSSLYFEF